MNEISITHFDRPWTLNAERSGGKRGHGHWTTTRELTASWREAFFFLAKAQKAPSWTQAHVIVDATMRHPISDTGNIYPAVKAALDGLIDAGVLPDDTAKHVLSITMNAPTRCEKDGRESMTMRIREA